jgi:transposase
VTGGLQTLAPLFKPLYEAIIDKHLSEDRWQADETRWQVFVTLEGKVGYRWYLWVFLSPSTVVYKLDPSRSAKVPLSHFSPTSKGIMVVDRYGAYKAVAKATLILLAFCWSHVRRDFIDLANSWPQQQDWAFQWLEDIRRLYHLNYLRLEVLSQPSLFVQRDRHLRTALKEMVQKQECQLREPTLHPACQKVLQSLKNHWQGLTVFVDHPEIPMDNNGSERTLRGAVCGRKNFYGSGSLWSGDLTAMLFSLLQTLAIWKINPRLWLQAYLEACATHQGLPPDDYQSFLPWNMSATKLQAFSLGHQPPDTS